MKAYVAVCATVACILAGAALAVSLTHSGPRGLTGPIGPPGQTGRNAEVAHLGMCMDLDSTGSYVQVVTSPVAVDGVPSCPALAVDLDAVRDDLANVVHQALEPAHVSLWISQHD
jgi:hypothetical protein